MAERHEGRRRQDKSINPIGTVTRTKEARKKARARARVKPHQLGNNRNKFRCDNEPAIEALAREFGQARHDELEKVSPTGSSNVQWSSLSPSQHTESCAPASNWDQNPARLIFVLVGGICIIPDKQVPHWHTHIQEFGEDSGHAKQTRVVRTENSDHDTLSEHPDSL